MKLIIFAKENTVIVDDTVHTVDLSPFNVPENVHVIRFDDNTAGVIEYSDNTPNAPITDMAPYQPIVDAFNDVVQSLIPPPATPAELAEITRFEINNAYEQAMLPISSKYPSSEIAGWPRQTAEAEKYRAMAAANPQPPLDGDTVNFPVLATLATSRGDTLLNLVVGVEQKTAAYDLVYGALTGKRQALEDTLDAIDLNSTTAVADINNIVVNFGA